MEPSPSSATSSQKPKLLNAVRQALRVLHFSYKTEKAYIPWIYKFIVFHKKRHPAQMEEGEIRDFRQTWPARYEKTGKNTVRT